MSKRGYDGQTRRRDTSRRHLYPVLDELFNGYSIHKIDAPDTLHSDSHDDGVARYLPSRALLWLESPGEPMPRMFFSALGTRIFALANQRCALVYNTETAATEIGPHAPDRMGCGYGITVVSGEKLYVLSWEKQRSFQEMSWAPAARSPPPTEGATQPWSWKTLPPPPPTFTCRQVVASYALHPDGCTIFVTTTCCREAPGCPLGTYSFNTKKSEWRWHGEWALPFSGQGFFDGELDAWVGLHPKGYICSCQVASRSSCITKPGRMKLDCQTTKEQLFHKQWDEHVGASLTYLGRSEFCLVESVARKGEGFDPEWALGDHHGCVLRVTVLGLSYSHRGELQIARRSSTRSYLVSRQNNCFTPVAFWI